MSFRASSGTAVRALKVAAVFLACLGVAGCATTPSNSQEAVVEARAQARWDALIAKDVAKAYEYLSPGTREAYPLQNYSAMVRTGMWQKVKVTGVKCQERDLCQVELVVDYIFKGSRISTPLQETWSRSGEQWWYVMK